MPPVTLPSDTYRAIESGSLWLLALRVRLSVDPEILAANAADVRPEYPTEVPPSSR